MKLKELIKNLSEYNPEADVEIVVGSSSRPYSILYGTSEGCTPKSCDTVVIYVEDRLVRSDRTS